MKKIFVKITDGKRVYIEDVTDDQQEIFTEYSINGSNPRLQDFDQYTRQLPESPLTTDWVSQFNTTDKNAHFIYGWLEAFTQSDSVPGWMHDPDEELYVSVFHEDGSANYPGSNPGRSIQTISGWFQN